MLRWQTAGESHGEALVAMIEGMPAGVRVTSQDIVGALARRRLGYGRGARMKFEQDQVRLLTGVRHGETLGSPIAIEIGNTEWPKWTQVMSADPLDHDLPREGTQRAAEPSAPRPCRPDRHAQIRLRRRPVRCWNAPAPARRPRAWRSALWRRCSWSSRWASAPWRM